MHNVHMVDMDNHRPGPGRQISGIYWCQEETTNKR